MRYCNNCKAIIEDEINKCQKCEYIFNDLDDFVKNIFNQLGDNFGE